MKGQNKRVKKMLTFVMLLALAVTTMQPLKSYASELEDTETTVGGEVDGLSDLTLFPDMLDVEEQAGQLMEAAEPQTQADGQAMTAKIEFTENTPVTEGNLNIYPKYDKGIIIFAYRYPNNGGGWSSAVNPVPYEHGEAYENIKSRAMAFRPENLTKEYPFSNWEQNYTYKEVGSTPAGVNYVGFVAKLAGIEAVEASLEYYTRTGIRHLVYTKFEQNRGAMDCQGYA